MLIRSVHDTCICDPRGSGTAGDVGSDFSGRSALQGTGQFGVEGNEVVQVRLAWILEPELYTLDFAGGRSEGPNARLRVFIVSRQAVRGDLFNAACGIPWLCQSHW